MDLGERAAGLSVVGPWLAGTFDVAGPAVGQVVYHIVDTREGRMKHVAVVAVVAAAVAALLQEVSRGRSDRPLAFEGYSH